MNNRELMQKTLDYIESNLKSEITAEELSNIAGFSLYHYYKLFQNTVGIPVMQYITRRRLLHCVYEIKQGKKMIDTALDYGFDTHSGFYKAFKREFNMSPSHFLKNYKANKPYKIDLFKEDYIMLTKKQISEVLKNWGLQNSEINDYYYINSGVRSENSFCVDDKYFIKFNINLAMLKNHIAVSKALKNVGFNSAVPITTVNDKEIVEDGELYCILTSKIDGLPLKSEDMYGDTGNPRFVGEIIGQLSLVLKEFGDIAVNETNVLESVKNYGIPKTKEMFNLSEEFYNNFIAAFEEVYQNLPKQIIHRDPNLANIIVYGEKFSFIDFDLTERNLRIVDPCYAATSVLSETKDESKFDEWLEIYTDIIIGFDSVVSLSDDEKKAIPYVILANQFIFTAWFSEQDKFMDLYLQNKKMTRFIIDNFDELHISF